MKAARKVFVQRGNTALPKGALNARAPAGPLLPNTRIRSRGEYQRRGAGGHGRRRGRAGLPQVGLGFLKA